MALNLLNEPIELKKISLKISTLKNYLEALRESYISANDIEIEDSKQTNEIDILINEFFFHAVTNEHFINQEESTDGEKKNLLNNLPFHPEIHPEKLSISNTFLGDINLEFISFFSVLPFIPGQTIVIEFNVPNNFTICSEVITCYNYNLYSKIISQDRPRFRVKAKFNYLREGERTLLRNFLQSVEPIKNHPPKQSQPTQGGEGSEDQEEVA